MAKSQKHGNKEAKKPKQKKVEAVAAPLLPSRATPPTSAGPKKKG